MYACTNFICCWSGAGNENLLFFEGAAGLFAMDVFAGAIITSFTGSTFARPELAACGVATINAKLQTKKGTCDFNIVLN
jgi:hypothetical protein